MDATVLQKKKKQNKQLILLYRRLLDLQDSCWATLFRFEKTQCFTKFQQRFSVSGIINIRLDDIIYMLLVLALQIIFGVLPIGQNVLTTAYRQSLALFYLTSFVVLISPHWFRWICLVLFCMVYPALLFLTFQGFISLMPVDNSIQIFEYLGYLSLVFIFVLLVMIYPLKEYIRNTVGSLYSYVYGLALTLILYLWPLYSFINQVSTTGSMSLNFIVNNQPLIIALMVLIITGFYFFSHHSLFQAKSQNVRKLLLEDFTVGQLTEILEEPVAQGQQSCLYRNFNIYVRLVSFLIYAITIAIQIYLYLKLVQNLNIVTAGLMLYAFAFIVFGSVIIFLPVSKEIIIPILAVISLSSAFASLFYFNSNTQTYLYYLISISFPSFAIFWSFIKSISQKRPIFRTNAIFGLYLALYLPAITIAINSHGLFTTNSQVIQGINYWLLTSIGAIVLFLIILFVGWQFCKDKQNTQEQKTRVPVDYNYFEQGNPQYKPYQITKSYGVSFLSSIDLSDIGFLSGMVFFLGTQLVAIHSLNLIRVTYATTVFYSSVIHNVIYSAIVINFLFYIYSHIFLTNPSGSAFRTVFVIIFAITSIGCLSTAFVANWQSTTFKIIGGFSILMILMVIGLEAIRSYSSKIFGFVSSIIVLGLWIFIILPYVTIIPFVSIFVNQQRFGTFIYICILGSVLLLVLLVGLLTLVFNKLLDKYQQQKKYKFVMQDVQTIFTQQGVQAQVQFLHVLYESFLFRDKKYVFFLKRGFPVNLLQDPSDQITKLVTSDVYNLKKIPTKKNMQQQQVNKTSCLWSCLTYCCGQQQQQLDQKLNKAKVLMGNQQLMALLPKILLNGLINAQPVAKQPMIKRNLKDPSKVNSSRSFILKDLNKGARYLGDEYAILKSSKDEDLGIEIWHNVFDFAANNDKKQPLIISNDYKYLLKAVGLQNQMDTFGEYASQEWGDYLGMNMDDFSKAIEHIAEKTYPEIKGPERKFYLLLNQFYYNLSCYEQFNSFMITKKTKQRISKNELQNSLFRNSYHRYLTHKKIKQTQQRTLVSKVRRQHQKKVMQPQVFNNQIQIQPKKIQEQKGISCKKSIYLKLLACKNCCTTQVTAQQFQRKLFVRAWSSMSVDVIKVMQRKEVQWDDAKQVKNNSLKCTFNNIIMAAFKLVDLYVYLSVSIMNPQVGWLSLSRINNLYTLFSIQVYAALGVALISIPMGIRGIMLIFQDRLGLTENRLPASFPHPMFFFTVIYKLLIISMFNLVVQTLLNTFNCDWTDPKVPPYTLYDDQSVQCFSEQHNIYVLISLIAIIIYYPLSSYAMPNFQFAEKSLDLKYRPSYLIFYFQVNFLLLAGKVLLGGVTETQIVQIIYNAFNIFLLAFLGLNVIFGRPCLVDWFNWIQLLVIVIGFIVNVLGLALYLTKLWIICLIVACSASALAIIITIIFIRRKYFSAQVQGGKQQEMDNIREIQMIWQSKQNKDKQIVKFENKNRRFDAMKRELPSKQIPQALNLQVEDMTQ